MYYEENMPYRCPRCKETKRFGSLIGLRMHMAIVHTMPLDARMNPENTSQHVTKDDEEAIYQWFRKGEEMMCQSSFMNEYPAVIDKMFDGFSDRAEMILRKYDRDFAEMDEKLRLARQLDVIRKQKQKLQETAAKWDAGYNMHKIMRNSSMPNSGSFKPVIEPSYTIPTTNAESGKRDKEDIFDIPKEQTQEKTENGDLSAEQDALCQQLDLSIQLAAKYKGQVLEMEKKFQEKQRSEENLRNYLDVATQKEAEAKVKLQNFMEDLLERAENAEEKVEFYKSQISLNISASEDRRSLPMENENFRSLPGSSTSTPVAPRNSKYGKPPIGPTLSSSAPSTPLQQSRRLKRHKGTPSSGRGGYYGGRAIDPYVTELLEPPSSQELPRKWKNRRHQPQDQLPGVDLSNVVDTSIMWPFSNSCEPYMTLNSSHSTGSTASSDASHCNLWHDKVVRRRIALFCVLAYLDTETLVRCSLICKEWRDVSRHPKLWTRVMLESKHISSEFLQNISVWCKEMCYLRLSNIKGRRRRSDENTHHFNKSTRGSLEDGLETLLKSCGSNLVVLTIDRCDHILTSRVLWLASCYNRELKSLTYRSTEPVNHEVIWSLGSGCQKLLSLDVAPVVPCKSPELFNNRVLQTISWCWPNLRGLSIGGRCIDKKGLLSIIVNCRKLQVLELSHMNEITEDIARDLVKNGLYSLESLMLTHTTVRTRALISLLRLASDYNLLSLRVQLSFSDYCLAEDRYPNVITGEDVDKSPLFEAFNKAMQALLVSQLLRDNTLDKKKEFAEET